MSGDPPHPCRRVVSIVSRLWSRDERWAGGSEQGLLGVTKAFLWAPIKCCFCTPVLLVVIAFVWDAPP